MASKKKKNVKKQDNWDDDDDKFEKKLKNLNVKSEDEEEKDGFSEDEAPVKSKKPAKSAFQLLVNKNFHALINLPTQHYYFTNLTF
jgi:hypothetical protein